MTSFAQCKTLEMLDDSCSDVFEGDGDKSMKGQITKDTTREGTVTNTLRDQEMEWITREEYIKRRKKDIEMGRKLKEMMKREKRDIGKS